MATEPVAAPAPTTTIPMTQPEPVVEGATRITEGTRQGWRLPDGSIVYDDGEKVVPPSGLSDQQKRDEALKQALGAVEGPIEVGVTPIEVETLQSAAAALLDPHEADEKRRRRAADVAKLRPADTEEEARKRYASIPPSAEEQRALLRRKARELVDVEAPRIEELKQLAGMPGVLLARDGAVVKGNALAILHNHLVEAVSCAERGDVARTAAALAELRRWGLSGAA